MDKSIRGITISLGADTTKLGNALKDVTKQSVSLSQELKQVERGLKFNPGNTELLAQKQQILAEQVTVTTEKLDKLKEAQTQINQKFAEGKISGEQYRAFNREIIATENHLKGLQNSMKEMEAEEGRIATSTRQLETLFQATGTSVDNFSSVLGGRLVNAIKSGTASSKQLDDAINKIGVEALGTTTDLEKMKQALASIDDGNSIANVKKELQSLANEAENTQKSLKDLDVDLENMLGAAVAGGGISGAIETALDTSKLKTKIDISFNVPEESKKSVEEAVRGIEAYGVDGEAALEGVRRQWALNKTASDEANTAIVKQAATIANSYAGIDFNELIQETNEIASELGISQEGAMGLTDALLRVGFPPEQLDIISEYGAQLTRAGYNAEEVQAIMEAGVETGTWNIDNLLDGLKEGRIKAAEFGQGVDKAMQEALQGTNISAEQLQKWGQSVAKGGKEGSAAMAEIAKALSNVGDETKRNELGVKLFGTMWEDQGMNITYALLGAQSKVVDFKKNQDQLNESVKKMDSSPAVQMEQAAANMKIALEPVLTLITNVISAFSTWAANNPILASSLLVIVTLIGIISGLFMAMAPFLALITAELLTFAGIMAVLTSPITIVIAAVAALIAIFVLFGDEIKRIYNEYFKPTIDQIISIVVDALGPAFEQGFTVIKGIVQDAFQIIQRLWNEILSPVFSFMMTVIKSQLLPTFQFVFGAIGSVVSDIFRGIGSVWNSVLKPILNGIIDFISGVFSGNWSKAWNGIVSIFEGVFNGLKAAAKAPINAVISMINGMIKGINNISVPDWIPGIGGKSASIPTVPMLATGGSVSGDGSFIVGEAGPELFTKSGSSVKVTPLSSREKSLGITGQITKLISDMRRIMDDNIKSLNENATLNVSYANAGMNSMDSITKDVVIQLTVDQPIVVDGRTVQRVVRKENLREDNINFLKRGQ
ncbi:MULTISPECIES: replication protein [unclassified Bacillus (in: firmicutes)]|uniref:replication protein n=1 Tax=unclassified Bacillus (in: firmicutes) TaxID=185979 RepID=UPI0008E0D932|nr:MULTISPECIES: replication protein [unclassified Bacillus (in: firmicutes)]SFI36216.1 Phage-related minor tail protein [Bacillus sp. 71mf]SFS34787.1 Phage-related minor tail protein [Bacillus sp. 103mf]